MNYNKVDYLKYYRVIKYYIQAKYKIDTPKLDMILFLNTERYFTREKFIEYQKLMYWDTKRFPSMIKEGWIYVFRKNIKNKKPIYELTDKARGMIREMYRLLNGEEITMKNMTTSIFKKEVKYTDKLYKDMIMKMRKALKEKHKDRSKEIL